MSTLLSLYRACAIAAAPLAPVWLWSRLRRGKEDAARLGERRGIASLPRPSGPLVWLHGASVGESLSLLPLIGRLAGTPVLVTTGTVTSARLMAERLPPGAFHQFVPLDVPSMVERFLDHWRPGLAIMAESELWPNTVEALRRRAIPAALVNARMSVRSFGRWRRVPGSIATVLSAFNIALAQGEADAERLSALGARHVAVTGNLKFDAGAPAADPATLAALQAAIGERPVWLAASTSPDEEQLLVDVHRQLVAERPDLLAIMVPRHPDRGEPLRDAASAAGLNVARRSAGERLENGTQLYVADTIGELGCFYRVSNVAFVGKSLVHPGGGQNPLEPAALGCAVLHGAAIGNFTDIYRELDRLGGARPVADATDLAAGLRDLLADEGLRDRLATSALAAVRAGQGATDRTLTALQPLLARAGVHLADA